MRETEERKNKCKKNKKKLKEKDSYQKYKLPAKGTKLYHLLHPHLRDIWDCGWIPRRRETTSRAEGLWAAPQLCWGVRGNTNETHLRRKSRGRRDVRISSIPAIICLVPAVVMPLPWDERETDWGTFGPGCCSAPWNCVTFTSFPVHALPCQQGGKCSYLLVFLPSCK